MARFKGIRERIHQPYYDTLVRGIGVSSVSNLFQLFGNANVGDRSRTNLQVAGQLAADSTYILKAIRCVMSFMALNDATYTNAFGSIAALTGSTATADRAHDLYTLCSYGANFTLNVGNKPMLNGPLWYIPAGGGPSGASTVTNRHQIVNGLPTQESILKLAKDIPIAARQNFNIGVEFFPFQRLGTGVGASGASISADLSPLDHLNNYDGLKNLQLHIDGISTRDVQ